MYKIIICDFKIIYLSENEIKKSEGTKNIRIIFKNMINILPGLNFLKPYNSILINKCNIIMTDKNLQ